MTGHLCRACAGSSGAVVVDLGDQPAADHFPPGDDPGPDPVHPLQMWLCAACGLAQLVTDPTVPEEPLAVEPAALREQAADAVARVAAEGWLAPGMRVAEYGSPHGGSWVGLLARWGPVVVDGPDDPADVVLDCFGMMHEPDQRAAVAARAARVAPGGVLLVQYHSLATILRLGQWTSLRHGHFAYYSTPALIGLLARAGMVAVRAWEFPLYGGTVLLAFRHGGDVGGTPHPSVAELEASERAEGVADPSRFAALQAGVRTRARALHDWLEAERHAGRRVLGYGAASRAVALLCCAGAGRALLPVVADASPAKQGRRMPGTDVPVVSPSELVAAGPDVVALFLPDLLDEVRRSVPEVEAAGARWVDVESLG